MIKKYTLLSIFFTCLIGQGVSSVDIQNLSNEDLDLIRETLKAEELQDIESIDSTVETIDIEEPIDINVEKDIYFGYEYFKREINFFDNIPTPPDFKLGPGDEITLSLWGETNSRKNFVINKEGLIYYENIGFINLSNQTMREAELILKKELSRIYSTLKDKENSTQLMLELGKLKSINVYFSGQIENPGINLIHPFSDIFSAIVQSGGIKEGGSLRQVQLIRNGNVISNVDFYSFFTDGKNNFSSTRILDGDVIHIPIVSKRVKIEGAINNPRYFELFDDESLADLIQYAGNL
ncbi:MAG: polysaccharide biosynthesis/export family protein, partial [Candidatus Neomarinimicrobiota bacterium]